MPCSFDCLVFYPAPALLLWQTFFADPFVQEHVRLDAVVCLCDSPRLLRALVAPLPSPLSTATVGASNSSDVDAAEEGSATLVEGGEQTSDETSTGGGGGGSGGGAAAASLVMSQLALSDRVLLNKSDLITPIEVRTALQYWRVSSELLVGLDMSLNL